jgi:hypothetical protein
MNYSTFLFSFLISSVLLSAYGRDPFWPIGYQGGGEVAVVQTAVKPAQRTAEPSRELTDEELRELARKESERIRQTLNRKATMIAGDKIYAYVQNKWVTTGDVITVQVLGNSYRLEILNLTTDNIELEAHRAIAPLQPQPRKQP